MYVLSKRTPEGRVVTMQLTSDDPTGNDFLTLLEQLSAHGGTLQVVLADGQVYSVEYPRCLRWLQ